METPPTLVSTTARCTDLQYFVTKPTAFKHPEIRFANDAQVRKRMGTNGARHRVASTRAPYERQLYSGI